MMLTYLTLIIGFIILVKGADLLVEGGYALGKHARLSDLVIGLTIIAFGTSAPEFFVNCVASIQKANGITIGNILGSNIANIFLGLGVAACIVPLGLNHQLMWQQIPMVFLSTLFVGLTVLGGWAGEAAWSISRLEGLLLLAGFVCFMVYTAKLSTATDSEDIKIHHTHTVTASAIMMTLGLAGLILGAHMIVKSALTLTVVWGISQSVIGLTIIALGTSLPELATCIMAVMKKKITIAVGNIIGSNIFNLLLVLGMSAVICPLSFRSINLIDLMVVLAATIFLFIAMFTGKRQSLDRWEGICFLILYAAYLGFRVLNQ